MAKFIEVTRDNGEKWLINTDKIVSLGVDSDNDVFITIYQDKRHEKGISIKESFDEMRQKLLGE